MQKNIKDAFVCPKCAQDKGVENVNTELSIKGMNIMFDDTLSVIMECKECQTIWKTYVKAQDVSGEVLFVKPEEAAENANTDKESVEQ